MAAEHHAEREAGREAAEGLVLPQHAGLGGERAVERDQLPEITLPSQRVLVPVVRVLPNEALGSHCPHVVAARPQLRRHRGACKLAAHGLKFGGVDQQAEGGVEGRLEFGRLQVFVPPLVVIVPLGEVGFEATGVLQAEPEQPAGAGVRSEAADLDGEGEDAPGSVERQPFLAAERADGLARAPPRARVGLGGDRDDAVLGEIEADDQPLVVRALE